MASAASGRAGNPLWLNMKDKTLMVEKQIARDPQAFLSNVRHELTGHAVGGGHGAKTAFIQMANGQTWTAHVIFEKRRREGRPHGRDPRLLGRRRIGEGGARAAASAVTAGHADSATPAA